jgi:hypothetical protein
LSGLFKWGGRNVDAPVLPSVPEASVDEIVTTSKVLPRLLSALAHRPAPILLDLGPVVGPNVSFFGDRLACKIHVEDLFTDIERHARQGTRDALQTDLPARLVHAPESIDAVLCWDLFDYLDRPASQALAARLSALVRPGGAIYGFFGTTPIDLAYYTRFVVEDEDRLRQRTYAATPVRRNVMVTRDINKMFAGLVVAESVLLKTSTREILFRRA